tara:strand:+ start:106 stop:477 length:372 start_codon:yes stop_codon:yes gene_type:complete
MMSELDKLEKGGVKVTSDNPLSAIEAKAITTGSKVKIAETRAKVIATRNSIRNQEVLEMILSQAKDGQYSLSLGHNCNTMEEVIKDWNPTIAYLRDLNYRVDCEFFNRPYDPNIVTLNISWRE